VFAQLKQALEAGVNVNEKFSEDISTQHEGMTPLALASALNKVEAVKVCDRRNLSRWLSCFLFFQK